MVFRENFFEYGIRNSIWLILIIMVESWVWYYFIVFSLPSDIFGTLASVFIAIGQFFINYEGYLTIATLLTINLLAAILASIAKEKYNQRLQKGMKIIV